MKAGLRFFSNNMNGCNVKICLFSEQHFFNFPNKNSIHRNFIKNNQISKQGLFNDPCGLLRLNGYVNLLQLNSDGILFICFCKIYTPLKRSSIKT